MNEIEELSLEETMKILEETVEKMESGELSLDQSIDVFEQGVKLIRHAHKTLDGYEQRISLLKKENGEIVEKEWEANDRAE